MAQQHAAPTTTSSRRGGRRGEPATPREQARRRTRRRRRIALLVVLVVFIAGVGVTGAVVYDRYGDRINQILGIGESNDYEGEGTGEVTIAIQSGQIGSDVATTLAKEGVTKTYTAFYQLLLKSPDVSFEPGNYKLKKQMSAKSALAALQDPKNRVVNTVLIPEGFSAEAAFEQLSAGTGIPVADFQAAAQDYVALGVPAEAPSIEGFLFPATYTFDPGVTAHDVLAKLVGEMNARLDAAGVAPADRFKVVTLASIVQRESGPSVEDMHKIARVFQNRLDDGMLLQSDATVAYGTGNTHRVTTTGAERADAANKYNTYANPGLPIGPIGLPGADAIDSALHPTDGPWLYFVAVNLKTGETRFSTTIAEHDAAVKEWQAWCRESDENRAYCA
ncbi:endolytic transglycosylase MltG [Schumannella sp. 10F1B-5-1]|nr:endolytic transglycosylase MltG [Schumannella sp. 10F1B-5-1]